MSLYAELHPGMVHPAGKDLQDAWNNILQTPHMHCMGAFLADHLVSTCTLSIMPNLTHGCRPYGLIENVVTMACHRKQGYASELMRHTLSVAWQYNCYKVMLLTGSRDEKVLHFYESAGFDRHAKQAFYAAAPV